MPRIRSKAKKAEILTLEEAVKNSDLILLLVAHDKNKSIDPVSTAGLMRHRLFLDTKNCADQEAYEKAGFETHLLGGH